MMNETVGMTTEKMLQAIGFIAPMLISFYCGLLMLLAGWRDKSRDSRRMVLRMAGAFFAAVCTWIGVGAFVLSPRLFIEIHSIVYWTALMTQILVYHTVFSLTRVRQDERFPAVHYVIPFVLCGALAVWSLFVPADIRLAIAERREFPSFYQAYAVLFTSKVPVYLAYNLFYSFRAFRRIRLYRRAVADYSADDYHSSVRWLYLLFIITLATIPLVLGLLVPIAFVRTLAAFLPVALTILQDILFAYNLFAANYVLIYPSDDAQTEEPEEGNGDKNTLDREKLEQYIREYKPYLLPGLRITDIVHPLETNRTYLSAFINREYGCNFKQFINRHRIDEYERLSADPQNANRPTNDLLHASGFSNYRCYQRAREEMPSFTTNE